MLYLLLHETLIILFDLHNIKTCQGTDPEMWATKDDNYSLYISATERFITLE